MAAAGATKLRVAIVGTGWGVRVQLPVFRHVGAEVTALWARSQEKADALASEHGIPFATSNYEELIAREDVDLVSIVTPPATHCDYSVLALEAGKHVLCDKPTALNVGEAARMVAAAKAHPEQLALIDHELRFLPAVQKARESVGKGTTFGEVVKIEANFSFKLAVPDSHSWWNQRECGGGIWGAIGSHIVDLVRFITRDEVAKVTGELTTAVKELPDREGKMQPCTSDDACSFELELVNSGASFTLDLSGVVEGPQTKELTFDCENGRVTVDLIANSVTLCDKDGSSSFEDPYPEQFTNTFAYGTVYFARALTEAITPGQSGFDNASLEGVAATFEDGLWVQAVLDAGYTAGNGEANTWVDVTRESA